MIRSLQHYAIMVRCVQRASNDPEDSVLISATRRDTVLMMTGLYLVVRMFPELRGVVSETLGKLEELADAQGFLEETEGVHDGE